MQAQMFMPGQELAKAMNLIASDASNYSHSVTEADALVSAHFANDDSLGGGGFFVAYFKKPGVKIAGLASTPFRGGTMLTTFCSPDRVKQHYKDVKYFKEARMGVVIYTSPKHLEILSEQV